MKTTSLVLLLGLVAFAMAGDCNNPQLAALATDYSVEVLTTPVTLAKADITYCKEILGDKELGSCCAKEIVNSLQSMQDVMKNKFQDVAATRDKKMVKIAEDVAPLLQESADNCTTMVDAMDADLKANMTARIAPIKEFMAQIKDKVPTIKADFKNYQTARATCFKTMMDLQGSALCLACDASYATQGVDGSTGSITMSDETCTRIMNACYDFVVNSAKQGQMQGVQKAVGMMQGYAAMGADMSGKARPNQVKQGEKLGSAGPPPPPPSGTGGMPSLPSGVSIPSGMPSGSTMPSTMPSGSTMPSTMPSGSQLPPSGVPSGSQLPPSGVPSGSQLPPSGVPSGSTMPSTMPSGSTMPSTMPSGSMNIPSMFKPSDISMPDFKGSLPSADFSGFDPAVLGASSSGTVDMSNLLALAKSDPASMLKNGVVPVQNFADQPKESDGLPKVVTGFQPADDTDRPPKVPKDCTSKTDCKWLCTNAFTKGKGNADVLGQGGEVDESDDGTAEPELVEGSGRILATSGEWKPSEGAAGTDTSVESDPSGVSTTSDTPTGASAANLLFKAFSCLVFIALIMV